MSNDRYPLSTADGKAIPFEVLSPKGFLTVAATAVVSNSVAVPANTSIMSVSSTVDTILRFGAAASVPATETLLSDAIWIPANMVVMIAALSSTFTVIRGGASDGTVTAQFYNAWAGLSLTTQNQRR